MSCELPGEVLFQSTRPSRGATWLWTITAGRWLRFQSTRPSRGATVFHQKNYQQQGISIHAPLAGRDRAMICARLISKLFQSTRPSRGATSRKFVLVLPLDISIHAPLAGRDHTNNAAI